MRVKQLNIDWKFILLWSLATTVGGAIGFIPVEPVGHAVRYYILNFIEGDSPLTWVMAVVYIWFGTAIGLMQWFVLRRKIPQSAWQWIVVSMLGWSAAMGIAMVLDYLETVGLFVFGILIGAFQWTFLRHHTPKAIWWILVNTPIWFIAIVTTYTLLFYGQDIPILRYAIENLVKVFKGFTLIGAMIGSVVGIMTGFGLAFILPQRSFIQS